ncbi:MAG: roadblock/LC7 domain-containing protein, partial [Longimicrobiales bacterium]
DAGGRDPARLFASLSAEAPFAGALLMDAQGLVMAGSFEDGQGREATLGARLAEAMEDAERAALHLGIGRWRGLMLESGDAVLHVSMLGADALVVLAARPDAPAGFVLHAARRAADLATRFLEGG